MKYEIKQIGVVQRENSSVSIKIYKEHCVSLQGIENFGHIHVVWWFDQYDDVQSRSVKQFTPPFEAPTLGVFASRSPCRPNPIAISSSRLVSVDWAACTLNIAAIDAYDGTPVLDIKPYMPMYDRVKRPKLPDWASHWPEWIPDEGMDADCMPGK